MLANTSSNPLTIPGERQAERKGHVISKSSFVEIKTIADVLHRQIRDDKAHHRLPYKDRDFGHFSRYAISAVTENKSIPMAVIAQDMTPQYALPSAIRSNDDIMASLNLTASLPGGHVYFYHYEQDPYFQTPCSVEAIAKGLDSLIARGRYGIWKKEMYNVHELGKIDQIYKRIDNANIDHD